ncbi:MAG: hypothetical protein HIU83_08385 [Proteobacteria bacterium]|nr:hypothetical protein [Pseudomonadota bacterium]
MSYYGWAPYVPVAERRTKALKQLEKLKKKGLNVQPVQLSGRKIADSFWGKGWCDHMESFGDYANRLPRGRSYVRNGSVCHLEIKSGRIEAIVSGSTLYNVSITIFPLAIHKWKAVKAACIGRIESLIDLLRGKLERGVMEVVSDRKAGLFPLPGEITFDCDCPDSAGMCKHIAAVLYGVGARLDHSPELLFHLRGVNHEELVDVSAVVTGVSKVGTSRRRIASSGLSDVFGVEMADTGDVEVKAPAITSTKRLITAIKTPDKSTTEPSLQKKQSPAPLKGGRKTSVSMLFPEPLTGSDIHAWRTSFGETQTVFAARFKITASSVSQWEKKGEAPIGMMPRTLSALRKAWKKSYP